MADLTGLAVPDTLELLREFLPAPPATICEMGCGRGALAQALSAEGYRVTGVEPDPEVAELARARGVEVIEASALDHHGGPYDVVLFTRSLHHVEPLGETIDHALSLLRPGGRLLLEEFGRDLADLAAAESFYDTLVLLRVADLLETTEYGPDRSEPSPSDDPWELWQAGHAPKPEHPLHTLAEIRAALAERGLTLTERPTDALWRPLAHLLRDSPRARQVIECYRDIERRRIAAGTLPAIGRIICATP